MRLHPVYIFFALFLSINQMNINSYRFGWLAVIMTMMYRESNPNISSCCKECINVCKTCSNIHYLIILSFTLILVAVTRNKIVTKEACSTLFECFFSSIEAIFFKSMVWPLETLFLDTMLIFIFQRSCLGQFNFYPQGSPESFANPNLCEPCK